MPFNIPKIKTPDVIKGLPNQGLEQRSYITLEFPNGQERRIPFFENIRISEAKKANYGKLNTLGRSSPIFVYFNSDSRMFDLGFSITLDHVLNVLSKDLNSLTFPQASQSNNGTLTREDFFSRAFKKDSAIEPTDYSAEDYDQDMYRFFQDSAPELSEDILLTDQTRALKARVINYILYWVNLVRTTTVNNAIDPRLGPPIVRITHGMLFNYVPCICAGYKIEFDEKAGVDRNTLLPRKIDISMDLLEVRHGNFGRFAPSKLIERDNICGWEAVLSGKTKSMDPMPRYRLPGGPNDQ